MNKILVVNINWLGDAVFSTPVFAALKFAYPDAYVACLCVPRVREVLRYCPHIDEIIVYDEKGKDRWIWNKVRMVLRLKRRGFDAAFLLHHSASRAWMVRLAGIPRRIGYGKMQGLLTHPVKTGGGSNQTSMHRIDYYLNVLEDYGIACPERRSELRLTQADIANMDMKLKKLGVGAQEKVIVFNTGGNWDLKRWPLDCWIGLAKRSAALPNVRIVFSGAMNDSVDAQTVIEAAGLLQALDFTGQTSLGESLALYKKAAVVVSADSGPLHLANSTGANVVGIFGPTQPAITGPRGVGEAVVLLKKMGCNHAPCYHLNCRSNVCMQSVGVDDVFQAVSKFIG